MQKAKLDYRNKFYRFIWNIIYVLLFRQSPKLFFRWRILILKIFGCQCHWNSRVYPRAKIWSPRNLILGRNATIASEVDIYNVSYVRIGDFTTISDKSFLCTASKTFNMKKRELLVGEISIGSECWIASDVSILPGVVIGDKVIILYGVIIDEHIAPKTVIKRVKNFTLESRTDDN
jgi:putative colanic acid biosynthesis acetyltransferase WcaF